MSEKRLNNTIFLMYLAAEEADESVENSTTDMAQKPISLQARLGDDGDATVGDLIPDAGSVKPFEATESHLLRELLQMVLGTLSGREREATIRNGCGSNRLCENARRIRHLRGRVGFMGCALFGHT